MSSILNTIKGRSCPCNDSVLQVETGKGCSLSNIGHVTIADTSHLRKYTTLTLLRKQASVLYMSGAVPSKCVIMYTVV